MLNIMLQLQFKRFLADFSNSSPKNNNLYCTALPLLDLCIFLKTFDYTFICGTLIIPLA